MVVMLASEDPSADGPPASTPRKGMDCADKSSTTTKKLVQARLPFKRLNPESKETRKPKRNRGPAAPPCLEPGASDGENEIDRPSPLVHHRPALVNGRGPLDGFMSRTKCPPAAPTPSITIDLTEDSSSADAAKQQPAPPTAASCPTTERDDITKITEAQSSTPAAHSEQDLDSSVVDTATPTELDTTMGSEEEEEEDGDQETEVSHGNGSLVSPGSNSSLSVADSSPEPTKSKATPTRGAETESKTPNSNTEQKKVKRRSLKNAQEQEERQKQREERERQKQEAKAAKEKKREEARKLKEEKEKERKERKEREEKERREKKEKEEKEKAEKLRAKEEQRKVKIEAKLEEKRKKEEEKRLKEEKDRIKAEKAEITRFLQKPKAQLAPKTLASACGKFAPFEIKEHMSLAPLTRVRCDDSVLEELDQHLTKQDANVIGLNFWPRHKPRRSGPTRPKLVDALSECLVVVDGAKADGVPDRRRYGRMKLLQFHENYRPAYWGTWSRKSRCISPRCPLRQDKVLLDYEVDSDEEWEEEEPGESLSHSEGDDDDEAGDDDDDDDGFFVPHGYLSDGEGALEEEEGGDPEKQKIRQKLKAREWDELMSKKKLKVLEAVVRGCYWEGAEPLPELLLPYAVCMLEPLPKEEPSTPEESSGQQKNQQLLSQLLPLLHGNVNSSKVIISEFQEFCRQQSSSSPTVSPHGSGDNVPTRIQLKRLIKENAVYEKRSTYRRCCWYVHAEVLSKFGHDALPVPCQWTYLTSGAQVPRDDASAPPGSQGNSPTTPQSSSTTPVSNKRKSAGSHSITKYMKRCSDVEQAEAMETDGFQADTEDEEDESDCIIVNAETESTPVNDTHTPSAQAEGPERMEVTPADTTPLPLPGPPATPATA
ncbi:chromatin assembly factor 1 subunit A [Chanos chanos]|uniref:Chromatin assembly factor 1 subunit A n=1 Tax=Chanos chanos TaxID=29144 RepID=A0A6J2W9S6_CHACN|nr:chromatin assembly factor 1 subunit A [Chanos chanos]